MKNQHIATAKGRASPEEGLYGAMTLIRDAREAALFLEDLCTPAELQAMVDRWKVLLLLKENLSYQKIHDQTGVSMTTIGRVARASMFGTGAYELIYQRMIGTDKKNEGQ